MLTSRNIWKSCIQVHSTESWTSFPSLSKRMTTSWKQTRYKTSVALSANYYSKRISGTNTTVLWILMISIDLPKLSSTAMYLRSKESCNLSILCACMPQWRAPIAKKRPSIWSSVSTARTHLSLMRRPKSTMWLLVASNKEGWVFSPSIAPMRLIFSQKVLISLKISISHKVRWKCTLTATDKINTSSGLISSKLDTRGLKMRRSLLYNQWR